MCNCCWQYKIYSRFILGLLRAKAGLLMWNRCPERHCCVAESDNLHHKSCNDTDTRKCPVSILREKQARRYSDFDLVSEVLGTGEKVWIWASRKPYRSLSFCPRSCPTISTQYKDLYKPTSDQHFLQGTVMHIISEHPNTPFTVGPSFLEGNLEKFLSHISL